MSTSLSIMPGEAVFHRQELDRVRAQLQEAREQLAEANELLRQERAKNAAITSGAHELRQILAPLHHALGLVFGEMEAMDVGGSPAATKNSAAWEQWKERLGGATARAIDALMVHGEMTQTQLRIILGCATRTVTNVVAALNQAKLIDKRDGKIRLKEL